MRIDGEILLLNTVSLISSFIKYSDKIVLKSSRDNANSIPVLEIYNNKIEKMINIFNKKYKTNQNTIYKRYKVANFNILPKTNESPIGNYKLKSLENDDILEVKIELLNDENELALKIFKEIMNDELFNNNSIIKIHGGEYINVVLCLGTIILANTKYKSWPKDLLITFTHTDNKKYKEDYYNVYIETYMNYESNNPDTLTEV